MWIKKHLFFHFIIMLHYAEACNEFAGPILASLRPGTQLLSKKCRRGGEPLATLVSRRVARIWKRGGGYFERVRSVQTTLTRIFIDLESVADGLSENWDEMFRKARKFKGFFLPKLGDLQKKKKKSSPKFRVIFRPKFKGFFHPKLGDLQKKKKKVFTTTETDISSNFANSDVWGGGCFRMGGLFSIYHRKSASKAQKTCDFAYFTSQWGGGSSLCLIRLARDLNLRPPASETNTLPLDQIKKYNNKKVICMIMRN